MRLSAVLVLVVVVSGCARITPLYRDYSSDGDEGDPRVERALITSGWTLGEAPVEGVFATRPRTFREWGLYRVEVQLEIVPLAGGFVRVLVHPYRRFFTGMRSKVPYLRAGLARSALADLDKALLAEGLTGVGSAIDRDRASRR